MFKKEMCHIIFLITLLSVFFLFGDEIQNILDRLVEECAKSIFLSCVVICICFVYFLFKCRGSIHFFLFLVGCVVEKVKKKLKIFRMTSLKKYKKRRDKK